MTRTDIHRPASPDFDPQAYKLTGCYDLSMPQMFAEYDALTGVMRTWRNPLYDEWQADLARLAGQGVHRAEHAGSRNCGHCGAHIRYAALLVRGDEWIYVGEDCLDNRFPLTAKEFQRLRKDAKLNAERETRAMVRAQRVERVKADHPELAPLFDPEWLQANGNGFLKDIARKAGEWPLSPRQIQAAGESIERVNARKAEAAEEAPAGPAPAGRVKVVGEVVWEGWKDTDFGRTHKMIVKADDGWKVWSTVPSSLEPGNYYDEHGMYQHLAGIEQGARVTFIATLEPKDDDPTFAFAKRPTQAALIADATA